MSSVSALRPEKMVGWYTRIAHVEGCESASVATDSVTAETDQRCGRRRSCVRSMQQRMREGPVGCRGNGAWRRRPTLSQLAASESGVRASTARASEASSGVERARTDIVKVDSNSGIAQILATSPSYATRPLYSSRSPVVIIPPPFGAARDLISGPLGGATVLTVAYSSRIRPSRMIPHRFD